MTLTDSHEVVPRDTSSRGLVRLSLALGFTLVATSVRAEEVQLSTEGRAERLFHSGEKKFDAGDYDQACKDFAESLKLGPKLGTLLNLALCHEMTQKTVTAWREFSHAAVWATQNNQRDRYEYAAQHIHALEPRLPRVVLQLPSDRAMETLDIDGEPVPEPHWYLPLYLDPGIHQLAVSAPGKKRTSVSFRVTASASDQLVYVPGLAPQTLERVGGTVVAVDRQKRTIGMAALGVGILGFAVGTTFGAMALAADDRDTIHGRATASTTAFVVGAVSAAIGGYLFWTSTTPAH